MEYGGIVGKLLYILYTHVFSYAYVWLMRKPPQEYLILEFFASFTGILWRIYLKGRK